MIFTIIIIVGIIAILCEVFGSSNVGNTGYNPSNHSEFNDPDFTDEEIEYDYLQNQDEE